MPGKYAAFLRGVNVGKRTVKKDRLSAVFTDLGFKEVSTFLASGNVLFEADTPPQTGRIEQALGEAFGFEIGVVVRRISDLEKLIGADPFENHSRGDDTKFYLGMSSGAVAAPLKEVKGMPGDFDLVGFKGSDFFAVAFRQDDGRYGSGLSRIDALFKEQTLTLRNWNTIVRLVKKAVS